MYRDTIVDEVRKNRENLFEKFDFDLHKFSLFLYEKQQEQKNKLISKPFEKEESVKV